MDLWPWPAGANEEGFASKIGPGDVFLFREQMVIRQGYDERFSPNTPGTAVRKIGRPDHERDVEPSGAQLGDRLSRRAFGNFQIDAGIIVTVSADQIGEEAMRDQAVDAYAQTTAFSQGRHAGRLHGMVEMFDAC